jgi:hypothetical protein
VRSVSGAAICLNKQGHEGVAGIFPAPVLGCAAAAPGCCAADLLYVKYILYGLPGGLEGGARAEGFAWAAWVVEASGVASGASEAWATSAKEVA